MKKIIQLWHFLSNVEESLKMQIKLSFHNMSCEFLTIFWQIFMMHIKQHNSDDLCCSPTYSLLCSDAIPVEQLWVKKKSCRNQTLFLHVTAKKKARWYTWQQPGNMGNTCSHIIVMEELFRSYKFKLPHCQNTLTNKSPAMGTLMLKYFLLMH